jgi:SAM-dependent methyltransferase
MTQFSSPQEDKSYLLSFYSIFSDRAEAEQYLYDSWERMQVVLTWLRDLEEKGVKKVLELGSNPYYLTLLMKKYFGFDLTLANFFGDTDNNGQQIQKIQNGPENHEFHFAHFNLEVDPFPYEIASFDCVIFCEILEHLLLSADFPLAEIARVLKPGGFVIVTTPNAARLANVVRLIRGKNIYADYSKHGIYGRHNREYTLQEVIDLLRRHDFEIVESQVRNIYPHPLKSRILQALRPRTWYEHLFVLARYKN